MKRRIVLFLGLLTISHLLFAQQRVKGAVKWDEDSIADWSNLPAEYVVSAVCPADAALLGLKSVSVFADLDYVNILLELNMDELPERDWMPLEIFINTDNSDTTGGYSDQFADANADIMLEGSLFSEGETISFSPAVFKWWGGESGKTNA